MTKVLVTGGSGFIAGHCIRQLLNQGYEVITTVRSDEKGAKVEKAHKVSATSNGQLSYQIVKDVAQEGAFDEVIKSIKDLDVVLHTASPFHYNVQDPVKDFLEPAVVGVTSILKAIKQYGPSVKRVVFTSSFAAIRNSLDTSPALYDESSWNPITWDQAAADTKLTYAGSKTLAERAGWAFMKDEKPSFDFVAINPSLVFGPVAPHLSTGEFDSINTSNVRILDMIQGKMKDKLAPTGFYTWVDVRDIAIAHVKAIEVSEAAGKRFLLMAGYQSNKDLATIIAAMGPQFKDKLPADLETLKDDTPSPDERYRFNNQQSIDVLGIKYTSLSTSVQDTVKSLIELGA